MKRICNLVCTIIFTVLFITLINIVVRANEPEPEGWDLRGLYGNDLHQSGDFQYLVYPDHYINQGNE